VTFYDLANTENSRLPIQEHSRNLGPGPMEAFWGRPIRPGFNPILTVTRRESSRLLLYALPTYISDLLFPEDESIPSADFFLAMAKMTSFESYNAKTTNISVRLVTSSILAC
jgi:hypothetical protein